MDNKYFTECKGCYTHHIYGSSKSSPDGKCSECKGKGKLETYGDEYSSNYIPCHRCKGTGVCPGCGGSGVITIKIEGLK